jgi:small subunit ribosomal protein S4
MGRYLGPKHRLARREGKNILEKTSESLSRRLNIPPGVHGPKGKRRGSEYGLQLREKQAARRTYQVLEKQFRRYYEMAKKTKGKTGETLLQILETRLDNLVYRLGFAASRNMARQMVSHGHVTVDGRKVNIPSYLVKVGQVIAVDARFLTGKEETKVPPWLERKANSGKLAALPAREQIPVDINEQLIVEFYSK